jgi:hypothetical protein
VALNHQFSAAKMRVYHFTSLKFGLEDLRLRRLKIATISDLNDPFDFLALGSSDRDMRIALEMLRARMSSSMGLLCFSKNWADPVQWTHYSDGHRGVCLGFDVPDSLLRAVRYQKRRPVLNTQALEGGVAGAVRQFEKLLTVKYVHWRYGREVRQFVPLREAQSDAGRFFIPFSRILVLREVIVGCRCNLTQPVLAKQLGSTKRSVMTRKARLSFQSFRVVLQRDARLWN